jgi:hypothetical protein
MNKKQLIVAWAKKKLFPNILMLFLVSSFVFAQDSVTKAAPEYEKLPLQLTIQLDKKIFKVGEPIEEIECNFKNTSEKSVLISNYLFPISFIIKNSNGRTIPRKSGNYLMNIALISKKNFITINPGESYKAIEGIATTKESIYYWKLNPGIYSVQAVYNNSDTGEKFGLNVCTGSIASTNTITIEVVE